MRPKPVLLLVAALALVAAACGTDSGSTTEPSAETPTSVAPTTPTTPPETTNAPVGGGTVNGDLTFTLADGYTATAIGEGIKPDLELAPDGIPGITYLHEDLAGFIAYTDAISDWVPQTVVEGYFYGPIGLAYNTEGEPRIAYHDHQDTSFNQDIGDLTFAKPTEGGWLIEAINDDGHDGWDSTIAIGADGVIRAAGVDPEQFGSTVGVEYYELGEAGWTVTEIGSGPVPYEFNVSLAIAADDRPALTYYDASSGDLKYASLGESGWSIEIVDAEGDAGRYSSLAFDDAGVPHISYLRLDTPTTGRVRHATFDGTAWITSDVGTLDNLRTGHTGTRRNTAVAVDSEGIPHVVYSDESVVKRAVLSGDSWETAIIVSAGDRPLGQLVSFRVDDGGVLHLATFEVTTESPLTGVVAYITES